MNAKPVELITVEDIKAAPVWEYLNDDEAGDTLVVPVESLPVEMLDGRLVGTQVKLANGSMRWAFIGNIDTRNAHTTDHFLDLSIWERERWFHLARYFDHDYSRRGPLALAKFLGLGVDEVFPISWDVSQYSSGDATALAGVVAAEPRERLSRAELIKLS